MNKAIRCLALLMSITLAGGGFAEAAAVRAGATGVALAANTRGSVVGYDSVNHVYLVVSTYGMMRGQFTDQNGGLLGTPFVIQATGNFTHFPTVAFSPDADGGAGGFLVAWHESVASIAVVKARVVSFAKSGPVSAETVLNSEGSFWEQYPAVAYSTVSQEFLVSWVKFGWGVRAIRADNSGIARGVAFTISQTGQFEGNPSVGYNPVNNQFLVVYKGWNNPGNFGFVDAQFVQPGTGQLIGAPFRLHAGGGTYITDVTYNTETNQFLAAWYRDAGGANKAMLGRLVNADASLPGNVVVLSSLWKAYDGLGLAYNRRTGTFFMVSHDGRGLPTSVEDGGVEINSNGTPVDNGFLVTANGGPNYYPRIAASTDDPTWMMVAAKGFAWTASQLVAGTAVDHAPTPNPQMSIDTPGSGVLQQPFLLAGWAADLGSTSGLGMDTVHVWAWPTNGAAPTFVGAVTPTWSRPDVAAAFGARFGTAGWGLTVGGLAPGTYVLAAYGHSTVANGFNIQRSVTVTISDPRMSIDTPGPNASVPHAAFLVGGWSIDRGAASGAGVDAIHVWAVPVLGGAPVWLGAGAYGSPRPDVAGAFGAQFLNSGYNLIVTNLTQGQWYITVYSHSAVTGTFNAAQVVKVTVQ